MKILEVCVDLDGGGIDRYLLNYCSRIKDIEFDFAVVDNGKIGILEEPIQKMGARIFRVPRQSGHLKENYKALKKIMTSESYDAVHVHLGYKGAIALYCAKKCGIKTRICHAHIAYEPEGIKQKLLRGVFTFLSKRYSTDLAACGVAAAKWVWGEDAYRKGKVAIINNAIESKRYAYSEKTRAEMRRRLGIDASTLVVGHVGRLCSQKNQLRVIDIFKAVLDKQPNSELILVGRGELEAAVKTKVDTLGLTDKVRLLGVRDDVDRLLNVFDVFVFPSTHEGLPFTLIETQCNGLPSISADTVTDMVKLGDRVNFLSLSESDDTWANSVINAAVGGHRADGYKDIIDNCYDIDVEAVKFRDYYYEVVKAKN